MIDFTIEAVETEPQFLQMLAPSEAVVAIGVEIRIGETVGMMNIAMPSIIIKMMRQKFDQQWSVRKSESTGGGAAAESSSWFGSPHCTSTPGWKGLRCCCGNCSTWRKAMY